MKLEIIPEADVAEDAILVCMVKGMVQDVPDNVDDNCSECGRVVVRRPTGFANLKVVCIICAMPHLNEDAEVSMTIEQLEDMKGMMKR